MSNPLFLNTVLLGGDTVEKLTAAHAAGFDQVELWVRDVDNMTGGAAAVCERASALSLGFTDYQVLLDFDGAPGEKRASKRAEAIGMLDTAWELGIATLLVPASTDPECDPARVGEDLSWLVDRARERGQRIAYEGMAWSTLNPTLGAAWDAVRDLDPAHAGLVLDSYHLFVRGGDESAIDVIPVDRIFLVQFSDVAEDVPLDRAKHVARHERLLPGYGILPLVSFARRLIGRGYTGPMGLEVFNDRMKEENPATVASEAMQALRSMLGRAVP